MSKHPDDWTNLPSRRAARGRQAADPRFDDTVPPYWDDDAVPEWEEPAEEAWPDPAGQPAAAQPADAASAQAAAADEPVADWNDPEPATVVQHHVPAPGEHRRRPRPESAPEAEPQADYAADTAAEDAHYAAGTTDRGWEAADDAHSYADNRGYAAADHGYADANQGYADDGQVYHDGRLDFFEDEPAAGRKRPVRTKKRARRRRNTIMLVVFAVFAAGLVGVVLFLQNLLGMGGGPEDYAGPGEGQVTFTVQEGAGPLVIAGALVEQDIISNSEIFLGELASQADGREVQPGEYQMQYKLPAADAAAILLEDVGEKVSYAAINRTWREEEVFAALSEGTNIPASEFAELAKDPQQFGLPKEARNLEGYLFPGEYRWPLETSAKDILTELVGNTVDRLTKDGISDPQEQFRVLTIASIIEAEAGEADYATVAGAIQNRLKPDNTETNGLIQSDATVTYGLGRKGYDITPEEKADKSNPYNTYAHTGLPAGPINSPGGPAIDAAASPADVPYYYWVTVNLDTGETKFAETLEQHNAYTKEYQQWCSTQKEGRCS
ncbi:endolytic transglycosylase MltG [Arthrobacter sp. CAU 1506]|uniref:endolytic transglycosylase MltG n=1 Tax=Arthrobacter sp. CAU 1506 TaxID=2560052 RepID=UPI001F113516|nr:endolytic transglycosylase MltG [Arthrobacter sp. CAU 1506]